MSIQSLLAELDIQRKTIHSVKRLDLDLHSYKTVVIEELKPYDYKMRREFADWALQ